MSRSSVMSVFVAGAYPPGGFLVEPSRAFHNNYSSETIYSCIEVSCTATLMSFVVTEHLSSAHTVGARSAGKGTGRKHPGAVTFVASG